MEFPNYELKALTDIWTGDVETNGGKLRLTGIKGSIRWWYEALVRGLGGYACDPTGTEKCELVKDKLLIFQNKYKELMKQRDGGKDPIKGALDAAEICSACQLFGCTGWGAKVRLEILSIANKNKDGDPIINQIKANTEFILKFIPLKPLTDDEKKLFNATIKIIVEYGAIGGKTVLKPSNHNNNSARHHKDYGIIGYVGEEIGKQDLAKITWPQIGKKSDDNEADWPDLKNFWFVKGAHLNRLQLNGLVSRDIADPKSGKYTDTPSCLQIFFGGFTPEDKKSVSVAIGQLINKRADNKNGRGGTGRDTESKKIFSFHGEDSDSKVQRCFGYTGRVDVNNKAEIDIFIVKVKKLIPQGDGISFLTGSDLLKIFSVKGDI